MPRSSAPNAHQLAVVISAALLLSGCTAAGSAAASRPPLTWGVFVADDGDPSSDLGTVAEMAGDAPDYVMRFAALDEEVPIGNLTEIVAAEATPVITLEPWQPTAGADQPAYALATLLSGDHDAALERWAEALAAWDQPVLLRFAHEMNGDWYPWAVGANGNTADQYVSAWRHMHDVFEKAGADEVSFVWSPNVPYEGHTADFGDLYPGADYVDVLGLDGYNGLADGSWQSPEQLFARGLTELRELDADTPILITETASAEGPNSGSDKASWIADFIDLLRSTDGVTGFIWFQTVKERDWRFNSTQEAQLALRDSLAGQD